MFLNNNKQTTAKGAWPGTGLVIRYLLLHSQENTPFRHARCDSARVSNATRPVTGGPRAKFARVLSNPAGYEKGHQSVDWRGGGDQTSDRERERERTTTRNPLSSVYSVREGSDASKRHEVWCQQRNRKPQPGVRNSAC
jgi:hypothetical protein